MAILLLVALMSLSCQTSQVSQRDIMAFIDNFEKKAEFINRKLSICQWQYYTEGQSDSLDYYQGLQSALFNDQKILPQLMNFKGLVSEDKYARKLDIIYRRCLRGVIDNQPEIVKLADSLDMAWREYKFMLEGRPTEEKALRSILISERDGLRRRAVYSALTARGNSLSDGLARLARLRNQATGRLGYNSYFDLMLTADGIDKAEYNQLLDQLEALTTEPYRRIIDSLSGLPDIDEMQIWDIDYALQAGTGTTDMFFPQNTQMTTAKATYGGMGINIEGLPIYAAFVDPNAKESYKSQLNVHVPEDVRVILELEPGQEALSDLLDRIGRAVYAVQIDKTDYFFTQPPAPCFEDAMGIMMGQLTENDSWLRRYAGIPEPDLMRLVASTSIGRLIYLRWNLVWLQFERVIYSDPYADLDRRFGEIFERYMLFPFQIDSHPWATCLEYINQPVSLQNRLLALCIVAQTNHYLGQKYGAIVDNPRTREFLVQNYYRFGGNIDWRTLVSRGTGESLNPKYILEYCGI